MLGPGPGTGPGGWQMSVLLSSFLSVIDTAASNETDAACFRISSAMTAAASSREIWDFFGGSDAGVETPVLWPPHAKS